MTAAVAAAESMTLRVRAVSGLTLGGVVGGSALGVSVFGLASLLNIVIARNVSVPVAVAFLSVAVLGLVSPRVASKLPSRRRQVPAHLLGGSFPRALVLTYFGARLGAGFLTFTHCALLYAVVGGVMLQTSLLSALIVGAMFGAARGIASVSDGFGSPGFAWRAPRGSILAGLASILGAFMASALIILASF